MDFDEEHITEGQLEESCDVCGRYLDEENVSRCSLCGRKFHMAWSRHAQVKNCGHTWINQMHCSIGFACEICLAEHPELGQFIIDTAQQTPPC